MREIKFRFYTNKKMIYPAETSGAGMEITGDDLIEEADWAVMQFTGLRDRNGTEIYEGDVVNKCFFDGEIIGTIKWCEYRAGFLHVPEETGKYGVGDSMTAISQFEVIGNIHEHAELLEVDK